MVAKEVFEKEDVTYLRTHDENNSSGVSFISSENDDSDISKEEEEEEEEEEAEGEKEVSTDNKTARSNQRLAGYQTPEPPTPELLTAESRRQNFLIFLIENSSLAVDISPTQRKMRRSRPMVTATAASMRSRRLRIC